MLLEREALEEIEFERVDVRGASASDPDIEKPEPAQRKPGQGAARAWTMQVLLNLLIDEYVVFDVEQEILSDLNIIGLTNQLVNNVSSAISFPTPFGGADADVHLIDERLPRLPLRVQTIQGTLRVGGKGKPAFRDDIELSPSDE